MKIENDVFISYNHQDTVDDFVEILRKKGLKVWYDKEKIEPGAEYFDVIDTAIKNSACAIICYREHGFGDWQKKEIEVIINRRTQKLIHLILVLFPDSDEKREFSEFLKTYSWVDLNEGSQNEKINQIKQNYYKILYKNE